MPLAAACFTNPATTVVRIVRVADGVRAAEQHLEADVRNRSRGAGAGAPTDPPTGTASPCRTSRRPTSRARRDPARRRATAPATASMSKLRTRVAMQRLVRVAERRVGDEQPLLRPASTPRSFFGPSSRSIWRVPGGDGRRAGRCAGSDRRAGAAPAACNPSRAGCRSR